MMSWGSNRLYFMSINSVSQFFYDARIAHGDCPRGYRFYDDASRADYRIVPNVVQNYGAVADPGVFSDVNLAVFLFLTADWFGEIVKAMGVPAGYDIDIAADECEFSDAAHAQGATSADVNGPADSDVAMGDPRAKLNAAIPSKFIEAHPIETAAKQDSDDAGKQAEKLRAGQKEIVLRTPARE
jgi:hypothetical protein